MSSREKDAEKEIDKTQERQQPSSSKGLKRKSEEGDGIEYLRRKHNFIKSTIRTDYQPDICKDYKETGFCGFGDSCKFLHDRSDYKHGWQLDQEWAKGEYQEDEDDKYLIKENNDDETDGISANCTICNEPYRNPIVTKCKHYFCIDCAEKECTVKCFACEQVTSGIFKNAEKIIDEKFPGRNIKISTAEKDSKDLENDRSKSDESDSESSKSLEKTETKEAESSDLSDYYD